MAWWYKETRRTTRNGRPLMVKSIRDKWIKALKSGKYKQGKERLYIPKTKHNKRAYCCLGVLCEVLNLKYNTPPESFLFLGSIPGFLLKKLKINKSTQNRLIGLNDEMLYVPDTPLSHQWVHKYNFDFIAKWIKENM